MSMPTIDQPAPDFTLPDQQGQPVSLAALKGQPVVVYFYPKAMTPGCTVQACGIRDSSEELKSIKAVVLGISPDPVKRLQKFVEKEGLNFPLLSDEDHSVAELYGVWGEKKFMGRTYIGVKRMTFIIDAEGVLRHIIDKVKTKSHHSDVLQWLGENL